MVRGGEEPTFLNSEAPHLWGHTRPSLSASLLSLPPPSEAVPESPLHPLIQPAGTSPLLTPTCGSPVPCNTDWFHYLCSHTWLPTGDLQKARKKHTWLCQMWSKWARPWAPSLANNFCSFEPRKQQPQLLTPGARSPGTASRCPMPYEKDLGGRPREHSTDPGDGTRSWHRPPPFFFQIMLLQQDLFILQWPLFLDSTC